MDTSPQPGHGKDVDPLSTSGTPDAVHTVAFSVISDTSV